MTRIADIVRQTDDIPTEKVHVALWGLDLEVRGMDLVTRSDYVAHVLEAQQDKDLETLATLDAELVINCTYDPEDGSRAFEDSDLGWMKDKAAAVIAPLSFKIQKMSGLDAFAEERLGKGFSTSAPTAVPTPASPPSDASSSDSPANSESPLENLSTDAADPSPATS